MSRTKSQASLRVETLEGRLVPAVSLPNPGTGGVAAVVPAIPAHSSNPGAPATVYLDFDGHRESDWGGVFVGPLRFGEHDNATARPFSLDANRASVSDAERAAIRNIWERVSEDFAPFNVNVTTVNPGDFSNGRGLRVAIGGSWQDWYGKSAGGVAMINSFTSRHENVVWVFADGFGNQPANIAKTVSHEAGHAFGLEHYPQPNSSDPSSLPRNPFPLMRQGHAFTDTTRTVWAAGKNAEGDAQDDMAVLAGDKNGFGYRADDHAGFAAAATWLNPVGGVVQRSGVIERNGDADMFAFWSGGGPAAFTITRATGTNLEHRIELRDARGNTIASTTGNTLPANLPRGVVYAVVSSTGGYGNVGQYTVKGLGISSAGYTTTGPRVIHGTAPVVTRVGSATFYLAFDKPMAASTVSSFVLMSGAQQLRTLRVEAMPGDHGGRYFRIHVGLPQIGSYTLKLGAGVKDVFGNRLDQNGDGVQGDAFGVSIRRIPVFGTA